MYDRAIRQFAFTLRNLDAIMGKAQQHAAARKFNIDNFCTARLFPDMLPFASQIRIACDHAKTAAAFLSRREAPKHEDNEVTFDDLRGRIAKCLAFLDGFTAADFAQTKPDTVVKLARPPGKGLSAHDYLFSRQLPNFYFHVTTAYNLLRQGGVDIGKNDFLGALPFVDA